MPDVLVRDAALEASAVDAILSDYARDAVSLEHNELSHLAEDVRSGRRAGLVGLTRGGDPVGTLLYRRRSEPSNIDADFVHVLSDHQTAETCRQFWPAIHAALMGVQPSEITIDAFLAGNPAAMETSLAELGFEHFPKYLMVRGLGEALSDLRATLTEVSRECWYTLSPWGAAAHEDVAHLLFAAHAVRTEARMGGDSLELALAEVASLTRSPVFSPRISTLAMEGSLPIGVAMVTEPSKADLMIVEVAVAPAKQGRGVGRAIMTRTLHEAALGQSESAWLVVNAANRPALGLYRSLGFRVAKHVINCRWRGA